MAENKKSFVLYADLIQNIDHLTNEEKGILFNHLLEYVNDMNPILEDRVVLSAWKFIQSQLKRDLIKFEEVKGKRSDAGKESARLRALKKAEQNPTKATSVESVQQASTNPTVSVNDNVNDNVINNILAEKINFSSLLDFINKTLGKNYRVINATVKAKYNARLKDGYLKEDFSTAITNSIKDKFHKENNFQYLTIEYFSRSATLDKYCNNGIAEKKVVKGTVWQKNPYDLTFAKQTNE